MSGDVHVVFAAETSELEGAFALARAQSQSLQREMAAVAREMVKTGQAADAALGEKLSSLGSALAAAKARMSELSAEMRTHATAALETGSALEGLGELAKRGLEFAGLAIGLDELKEFFLSATEAAEKIERLSAQLGASTDEIQAIGGVAKLTGTDLDELTRSLERMELGLAKSQSAASPARAALAALGLEAEHFRSLSTPEQLLTLADAFSRFADGPTKTAAAMALLGRSGADMIPYLDRGRDKIKELSDIAQRAGAVMSKDMVKGLAESKEHSAELGLAVQGLGNQMLSQLDPAIDQSIQWLTRQIEAFTQASRAANEYSEATIHAALAQSRLWFTTPANIPVLDPTGSALRNAIGQGGGGNITVHPKPQVPEMQIGGSGRTKNTACGEAREQFSDEIDAAKRAAEEEEDILNNQVRQHKISWDQWAAGSIAALEAEKTAVQQAANAALASTALSSTQKLEIMRKEADELAAIAKKERDDQAKAAEESMRSWESLAKGVQGIADSQLKGLLTGTESFSTAIKKMAEEAVMKLIELGENLTRDMLLGQSLGTALNSEGLGGLLGGAANLLGIGGGAAAAAGGGGLFADAELGGAILGAPLGFASGAWEIPQHQLAMVHQGEMIVPSQGGIADNFRAMLSGGLSPSGGDTHYHSHNWHIDGSKSPIDTAREVAKILDRNPSLRSRY